MNRYIGALIGGTHGLFLSGLFSARYALAGVIVGVVLFLIASTIRRA